MKTWDQCNGNDIRIDMTEEVVNSMPRIGNCEEATLTISQLPEIKEQTDEWGKDNLREELMEYGAWDDEELKDHAQNIQRMLWMICGDLLDEMTE